MPGVPQQLLHCPCPQVFCRISDCPDDTYSRCGPYCYNSALPLGDLSEDDCSAFLGEGGELLGCA